MNEDIRMPDEYIHRIYADERFRNAIAYAHGCYVNGGKFSHYCAMTPEGRYIVYEEEIECAKTFLATCKEEVFAKNQHDLLFVSMGCDYAPRYEDDPGNHRIRTEFLNKNGHRFFIEVCRRGQDEMRIDHSIDRESEIKYNETISRLHKEYTKMDIRDPKREEAKKRYFDESGLEHGFNFGGIEHADLGMKYTKKNILKLVNDIFDCLFRDIVIDRRTISMNDREIICSSPTCLTIKVPENKPIMQLELF